MSTLTEYELAGIEVIARGICIKDEKLLLCRAKGAQTTYLPGGHIEFGETGREALVREMREETGLAAAVGRFRGVIENTFQQHGKPHAEINLVYEMTVSGANAEHTSLPSREDWIEFVWWPLADLAAANILPRTFLNLSTDPSATFTP